MTLIVDRCVSTFCANFTNFFDLSKKFFFVQDVVELQEAHRLTALAAPSRKRFHKNPVALFAKPDRLAFARCASVNQCKVGCSVIVKSKRRAFAKRPLHHLFFVAVVAELPNRSNNHQSVTHHLISPPQPRLFCICCVCF